MKRIVVVLALALIAGVLAVACNGDGVGEESPTPSLTTTAVPGVTATPAAPAFSGQIAYILPEEGDIWLVSADGSGARRLVQGQCRQAAGPLWSHRGDKIACVSRGTGEEPQTKIAVFDLEGRTVALAEHKAWLAGFAWSADGRHFVYGISEGDAVEAARPILIIGDAESEATVRLEDAQDGRWSPDGSQLAYLKAGGELTIYDLPSGQTRALGRGLRPLAWALGDEALLVAADYQEQEMAVNYEASLLDVASGQMTRVPELDNGTQFWLSPDGQAAAFLAGPAARPEGGVTISILDLTTRNVTAIEGAVIGYPSEAIPYDHVAFSVDGAHVYWVDVVTKSGQDRSGTIYRARPDGSELTQLATVKATLFSFSPDRTMVLYSDGAALWVAGVDGSDARSLAEVVAMGWPPAAWRPLP